MAKGKITIPAKTNVWEHEMKTAKALADAGFEVRFIPKDNGQGVKSADIVIDEIKYEMKAPKSSKLAAVERNLKRAYHQSNSIVFDSRRMKRLTDKSIKKELLKQFRLTKKVKRLLFVDRRGRVVDIGSLG
jgi:hypothetical protein